MFSPHVFHTRPEHSRPPAAVAVLASGRGSNLGALIAARNAGRLPGARLVAAFSDKPRAPALEMASAAGMVSVALPASDYADKAAMEVNLVARLRALEVEWIVLAGYMRIVGPTLLDAFPWRIVNIHPSLLPAFQGLHGAGQALAHGAKVAGCTVHFVTAGMDEGPIIAQAAVAVLPGDDEASLSARILEQEHRILPEALATLTGQAWVLEGRRFRVMDSREHSAPGERLTARV